MARRYFGTDGIRGQVGSDPMTVDFALRLASAAARVLTPQGGTVLIGKDTRVSGYMFESALEAGFVAAGVDVLLTGPLPTPAIAVLTKKFGANFGIVISASHNPYYDNGIKFFDAEGEKLSDDREEAIEQGLADTPITRDSRALGQAKSASSALGEYMAFCKGTIPADMGFEDFKIVVDASHGAGYKAAPRVMADLGADVVAVGCSPNGRNINEGCGSMRPDLLKLTVAGVRANVGMALDGDGDRVVMVDERGQLVGGDQLLYVLACDRLESNTLRGPVVGTVMSNLGLEVALRERGVKFERAKVGDRYVLARLKEKGGILGGETSGHVLCLDRTTTGDGLVTALQVLAVMRRTGRSLSELAGGMRQFPQVLLNVKVAKRADPGLDPSVRRAVDAVEAKLGERGRVVLRASGTEPVIRVMVEGEDRGEVSAFAEELAECVKTAFGAS
ncbi:MAG TPA: phosphoglucosamine mutase [Gammaproteobacteria bacterium]|nr:phosphoglucosamine mutase [Gammaproteobacteria bacterium]